MKKIISIILTLVIITSCVAVGTISSSAVTSMKIRTKTSDSTLYEGMESRMRVGLDCGKDCVRIDDLKCMQKYITYTSSNKSKVFVTTSGKVLCLDSATTVKLTAKLKVPSNYYEHKNLIQNVTKENLLKGIALSKYLYRGSTATASVSVNVKPLKLSGYAKYFGAISHTAYLKSTSSKNILVKLTSTRKNTAYGLLRIETPYAKNSLKWVSANSSLLRVIQPKEYKGYMGFEIKNPYFNGYVKLYLKDSSNNILRTIRVYNKYVV